MQKKQNTWEMGPTHGATTANVKRYIDFAARHSFSGVLAEGWNPGWGEGEQISYLKAYPDFDIDEACRYALYKGVRFIGHTETWGNTRLLEQQMDSAAQFPGCRKAVPRHHLRRRPRCRLRKRPLPYDHPSGDGQQPFDPASAAGPQRRCCGEDRKDC
jgi:hypothetical protein